MFWFNPEGLRYAQFRKVQQDISNHAIEVDGEWHELVLDQYYLEQVKENLYL